MTQQLGKAADLRRGLEDVVGGRHRLGGFDEIAADGHVHVRDARRRGGRQRRADASVRRLRRRHGRHRQNGQEYEKAGVDSANDSHCRLSLKLNVSWIMILTLTGLPLMVAGVKRHCRAVQIASASSPWTVSSDSVTR